MQTERFKSYPMTQPGLADSLSKLGKIKRKEINPEYLLGGTDAEAEAPMLWPPDAKSQLTGKAPDAGKDGRQEEKGMTEDEMLGRHH